MNKLVFTAISLLSFTTINAAEELPDQQSILHVPPITPICSRAANNEIAFFPDENSFESQGKNHPPHKSFVILSSSSANPKPTR